jgi:hypothetical protein
VRQPHVQIPYGAENDPAEILTSVPLLNSFFTNFCHHFACLDDPGVRCLAKIGISNVAEKHGPIK